jgi:alpha-galactosidase
MLKKYLTIFICFFVVNLFAQINQAPTPPMGWMTWNFFWDKLHEKDIREMADAMVESGMAKMGYNYLFIDDGWQGGRDNKNNLVPDPEKFPSGIKALVDYIHGKGLKVGIYSNAAPLTCGGYTASLHFEEQDAKRFAEWEIDYLKYDYCDAPEDPITAQIRYKAMSDALKKCGRNIPLGICEWGGRKPWNWASEVGGVLWRTTFDIRDKWKCLTPIPEDRNKVGHGIMDIYDVNVGLHHFAGPNKWNDCDMLIVGLYGNPGPTSLKGGVGCNDIEYQSQMSLWSMMASPLAASNDLRKMNAETKRILMNPDIIAINQDILGKQAVRKIHSEKIDVLTKELSNGDIAVAILNRSDANMNYTLNLIDVGLKGNYDVRDIWMGKDLGSLSQINKNIKAHETLVYRLKFKSK